MNCKTILMIPVISMNPGSRALAIVLSIAAILFLSGALPGPAAAEVTVTKIGDLPADNYGLGAVEYNGTIYAVGGYSGGSVSDILKISPSTGTSTKLGDLPTGRTDLGVAECNGKIYAIGGYGDTGYGYNDYLSDIFEPQRGDFPLMKSSFPL